MMYGCPSAVMPVSYTSTMWGCPEAPEGHAFAGEPFATGGVESCRKHFYGDVAVQRPFMCAIDDRKPATTDLDQVVKSVNPEPNRHRGHLSVKSILTARPPTARMR